MTAARAVPRGARGRPARSTARVAGSTSARSSFQPSEFAKLALVVWTAAYLSRAQAAAHPAGARRPLGSLVLRLRSARSRRARPRDGADVIMLVVGAILLVSGTRMSLLATAYGLVIALAAIAAWSSPYRRDRLLTFLDPWKDPTGAGLQNVQALISLGSGGIFGRGLGQGPAPLQYLPEAHDRHDGRRHRRGSSASSGCPRDHGVLRLRAMRGSGSRSRASDPFAKRLAAGITALVCGQAAINMAAVSRAGAAHRDPASVRLLRRLEPHRDARSRSASSLTSLVMADERQLRCLIAAGGTVGHVAPALAVAEALRAARRARDVRRVAGSRRGAARS